MGSAGGGTAAAGVNGDADVTGRTIAAEAINAKRWSRRDMASLPGVETSRE